MSDAIAPLLSPVLAIAPGWIDYNGHLNQAYYSVLFDKGLDAVLVAAGLGPETVQKRGFTYMTVETHYCYVREMFVSDPVQMSALVLSVDDKRLHMYCELRHASDGWLACTSEWMFLAISMETRRAAPWPADIRANLDALKEASARLSVPERAGRAISMGRASATSR